MEIALVSGVVVTGLLIALVAALFSGRNRASMKLSLATRVPIRDAVDGDLVKLQGKIVPVPGAELVSRIDGRSLVGAHLALRYSAVVGGVSKPIHIDECREFLIVDDTGEALVRASDAKLLLTALPTTLPTTGHETVTYGRADLPAWLGELWSKNGVHIEPGKGRRTDARDTFSVDEAVLVADKLVAVLGRARRVVEPGAPPDRGSRLVLEPDPEIGLLIGDDATQMDN